MAEARGRAAWDHTAQVLCLVANVNRDPKRSRAFRPEDFHPFARGKRRRSVKSRVSVEALTRDILAVAESKRKGG